jgi:hypothetical protein
MSKSDLGERLNAATDEMNRQITRLQDGLQLLGLGVSAEVSMGDDRILGFGKDSREWILYTRARTENSQTLLVNASRKIRIDAVAYVPSLIQEMKATCEAQLKAVQVSTKAYETINEALFSGD